MLAIDLKNAFRGDADNFTAMLLRLIAKADSDNRRKLALGYPDEVNAVTVYQRWCPYRDAALTEVDWDEIERRAKLMTAKQKG